MVSMNELHLFAGAGGGILGGMLLGHTCVCAVEIEPYCRKVLFQRQRDGILPKFPIWDDVTTFDGRPWRGKIDVVCGGFPCQDISCAGKGAGIEGERSGLWSEMARIIREVRPRYAFVENSPMLVGRGLAVVLGDLAEMGYDAKWGVIGSDQTGAPFRRARIWVVACSDKGRFSLSQRAFKGSQKQKKYRPRSDTYNARGFRPDETSGFVSSSGEPCLLGGDNVIPHAVDRLKAIGNAQDPVVAATAFKLLGQNQ
jgi:DNA (cytosine-5)-methyltransferase 1